MYVMLGSWLQKDEELMIIQQRLKNVKN